MLNIYKVASDELVTDLLMEYVRPRSRGEYESMMYAAVTHFPKNRGENFVVTDYDKLIALTVDDIVDDVLLFHGFMTHKMSEKQKAVLPPTKWGDADGERSLVQIAMQCLEPHARQFKSIINASDIGHKVKKISSLEVWAQVIKKVNDDHANLAILLRETNLKSMPVEKAEVIQSKAHDLQTQRSFINGKGEKRELEGRRREAEGEGDLHRMEYEYQGYEWEDQQYPPRGGNPRLQAFDWENPKHPERGPQPVRGPRAPGRGASYGGRDAGRGGGRAQDQRGGRQGRGGFGPRPPPVGLQRGPPPAREVPPQPREFSPDKPMVCYKFAITGKCDKGKDCEYRHDPTLAQKYLEMKVKYLMDSVHWAKTNPRSDSPRLSLFTEPEREEVDWYEMQKIDCEEQRRLEEEVEQEGYDEEYGEDEVVVEGYDAPYRS